jgi:L-glyceraldehyde 3-phosphate reductase
MDRYSPAADRYDHMTYRRCGRSGLRLPLISLGFWHNFGDVDDYESYKKIAWKAFDKGITHFDLANNYGPPPGSAEANVGKILRLDFHGYRDEMIISSKAGYLMWPGPYGEWGSRKYLIASCDQSLKRMGLEYFDIFYSHRFDPDTPLEETMGALDSIVRSGKALYAGISSYDAEQTQKAKAILDKLGTPCVIHQPKYSMLDRWVEDGLMDVLGREGIGCIAFSPLSQGLLSDRYLKGIPKDSRAAKPHGYLQGSAITTDMVKKLTSLNAIAKKRGQSLAQMAIAWLLKDERVTSVLIGASSVSQLEDSLGSLQNCQFSNDELSQIEAVLHSK